MSVYTTQGYKFRLVAGSGSYAERTNLDLFEDEEIKISNNITNLFDIGAVPGTLTRTISLPGTKKNNAFFQQYYDISVYEPDLFSTNQKVEAYIDFDGIYLVNGYLQLQKVNVIENKFIDSYEVNLFGIVSNFSTDAKRLFLTDLDNLSIYNHTSSIANVSASWQGNLFSGSIVYALTDSGTGIYYQQTQDFLGIDDNEGALNVQDFKTAIKLKTLWDACFDKLGYTYTSSFFNSPIFDSAYLILNNNLQYPVYRNIILDGLATFKTANITGSFQDIVLSPSTYVGFPANSIEYDIDGVVDLGSPIKITIPKESNLAARINLVFNIKKTGGAGSGLPTFFLKYVNTVTSAVINTQTLANINRYLEILANSRTTTVEETFELPSDFQIPSLPANVPVAVYIEQVPYGVNNFTCTLNPQSSNVGSSIEVLALNQGADFETLDVPFNMPYGTSGIPILNFIRAIQKKFNLVLYEDNTVPNQFIVDTFNEWYKKGQYQNFNKYINLDQKLEFIPANTLSVNKLDFTDTQDTDYISTLWQRKYNRTFGEAVLIDSGSYFSQGEFKIDTTLASGPLGLVPGSVATGSITTGTCTTYQFSTTGVYTSGIVYYTKCDGTPVTASLNSIYGPASITDCVSNNAPRSLFGSITQTALGDCSPSASIISGSQFPMYIPYYISQDNKPARVMPRIMFYNGQLPATPYWIQGYGISTGSLSVDRYYGYPYFDNYSVISGSAVPTSGSYSLLFNNETPSLGTTPTNSLLDAYWTKYLGLLYNPRTRLVNALAVIPLADYFAIELNDVVQFRSNYYHLRAINDYNLTTGECAVQLLGPVIADAVSSVVFDTPTPICEPTTTTTTSTTTTTTTIISTSTTTTTTTFCYDTYRANIYDSDCNPLYTNVIVRGNANPYTINYYYSGSNLGGGTIVQFLEQSCEFAEYFTTTGIGSFTCPPPA